MLSLSQTGSDQCRMAHQSHLAVKDGRTSLAFRGKKDCLEWLGYPQASHNEVGAPIRRARRAILWDGRMGKEASPCR